MLTNACSMWTDWFSWEFFCLKKESALTEERVRALQETREPETVSEVRSFLGLSNYSSRFIPHFATITEPLRKLTRKDVPFHFGPEQKASFESLKQSMAEAGTLAYFDKRASTKVVADASPVGHRSCTNAKPEWGMGTNLLCKPQPHRV